ncbi:MAG: hypothetical protein EOO78_16770 [Oxalobacteraceae bacterium]|nr:MAG: hypothetical protein EOO78_16770 [Oxalobacteraceae bacterium]
MVQYLVVAVIVLLAALHAGAKYLPVAWRRKLVYKLRDRGQGNGRVAKWLMNRLDADGSCGSGCDTCGSCETEALPATDAKGRKVIQLHVKR